MARCNESSCSDAARSDSLNSPKCRRARARMGVSVMSRSRNIILWRVMDHLRPFGLALSGFAHPRTASATKAFSCRGFAPRRDIPFPPMAEYYPSSIIVDMMRHPSSSGGEASRSDRDGPAELMTA